MDKLSDNIFEAFKGVYEKNPKREVIFFKEYKEYSSLTYQDLYKQINKIAAFLVENGVKNKEPLVLILENSYLWPAAFLAIMRIGAVAVPLNPQLDSEEMTNLLKHSDTKYILSNLSLYTRIKEATKDMDIKIFAVDSDEITKQKNKTAILEKIEINTTGDCLASIVYTSGTTSTPKGVMLTHKNFLSNVASIEKLNLMTPEDCVVSILPYYHTYPFMVNLLFPILIGAKISFPLYIDAQEIMECIKKTGVTLFVGVPRLFSLFYEKIKKNIESIFILKKIILSLFLNIFLFLRKHFGINLAKAILGELHEKFGEPFRFMISGGAKLNPEVARAFYKWGFTILEGYGLTETSPVATFNTPDQFKIGSIGRPSPRVEVRINSPDESGIGEIIIKGANVTRGYYKADNLTQIAIKDGWFYSGDLGYKDKEGFIYIYNRKKELIVLSSGKKITPEEVESYYSKSPFIQEICVFLTQDPTSSKDTLSAAILPNYTNLKTKGITQVKDRMRWEIENISRKLPSYKRVKKYTIVNEQLPKTALGKIKRYLVKEKYEIRWEETKLKYQLTAEDERLLSSSLCKKAYEYLCNKLKKTVNLNDNLEIDLGLDSLEQIGLFLEFQQITGIKFEGQDVFNIYTVRDVLSTLSKITGEGIAKTGKPVSPLEEMFNAPVDEKIKKSIVLKNSRLQKIVNFAVRSFLKGFFRIFFRLETEGLESIPSKGPLILCPNHASYLDGPLLLATLKSETLINTYVLGFKLYFDNPLLKWAKKPLRLISIEARLDLAESLKSCSYILKNEKILCIFGEGGRSIDGNIMEFKRGLGILIKELNTSAVPIYIKGSFEAWPRYRLLPRPKKIKIIFGKPITCQELMEKTGDGVDIYKNIVHNLRSELLKLQSLSLK